MSVLCKMIGHRFWDYIGAGYEKRYFSYCQRCGRRGG